MMVETNMDKVKNVAIGLLYQDVISNENIPFVVHHPFTNSNTVMIHDQATDEPKIIDIVNDLEGRETWMKSLEDHINKCSEPWQIMAMMNKPYYFAFIKYAHSWCNNSDLGMLLSHAWVSVEYSNEDANMTPSEVIELMESVPSADLMTAEDLKLFEAIGEDEPILVFRGVTAYNESRVNDAISWTLDIEVAKFFASRFNADGNIYCKIIYKKDIVAYFNTRDENEVIVRPTGGALIYREPEGESV